MVRPSRLLRPSPPPLSPAFLPFRLRARFSIQEKRKLCHERDSTRVHPANARNIRTAGSAQGASGTLPPAKIERLIRGVPARKLRTRPVPGKWSVAEILAHLADGEIVVGWRMRQILGAPGITLQPFDQDVWAAAGHYDKRDARVKALRNSVPRAKATWRC